jgi:hypothetical protein
MPSADDYGLYNSMQGKGFWQMNKEVYFTWTGRYIGTFLTIVVQYVRDYGNAFFIVPFTYLLCMVASVYFACYQLFKTTLSLKRIYFLTAAIVSMLYAYCPSLPEILYWLPAVLLYKTSILFAFIFMGSFGIKSPYLKLTIQTICIVIIMGCNEMMLLIINGLLFLSNGLYYLKHKTLHKPLMFLFTISLLFALIEVLAPGNYARMATSPMAKSIIKSLAGASVSTGLIIIKNALLSLLTAIIFYITISTKNSKHTNMLTTYWQPYKRYISGCYIAIIVGCYFISYYSSGHLMAARTENVVFVFTWLGAATLLCGYFMNTRVLNNIRVAGNKYTHTLILSIMFGLQFFNNDNNVTTAYLDLLTKQAQQSKITLQQRDKQLREGSGKTIFVDPLQRVPASLFYKELADTTATENIWINQQAAVYYKQKAIWLNKEATWPVSNYMLFKNWLTQKN